MNRSGQLTTKLNGQTEFVLYFILQMFIVAVTGFESPQTPPVIPDVPETPTPLNFTNSSVINMLDYLFDDLLGTIGVNNLIYYLSNGTST